MKTFTKVQTFSEMKNIFLTIIFTLFICSCGSTRYIPERDSVIIDRTIYKEMHDTTICYILKDSTTQNVVAVSDTSHLETDVAESDAWIDKEGRLNHTISNKITPIPLSLQIPNYVTHETELVRKTVIKEVERELTRMQSFFLTCGKVSLGIFVGLLLFIIFRKFRIFGL